MKKRKIWEETQQNSWPLKAALSVGNPGGPPKPCFGFFGDTDVDHMYCKACIWN